MLECAKEVPDWRKQGEYYCCYYGSQKRFYARATVLGKCLNGNKQGEGCCGYYGSHKRFYARATVLGKCLNGSKQGEDCCYY